MATTPSPTVITLPVQKWLNQVLVSPPGLHTPSHCDSAESVLPVAHYLYLHVKAEGDCPLPPALFKCEVISGMCLSKVGDAPQEMLVYSYTKAIREYGESVDLDLVASRMGLTTTWVGQTVVTHCHVADGEEVVQAWHRLEDRGLEQGLPCPQPKDNETWFFRMMEDIHTLAHQPNGDALQIPNFSGSLPPGKGEVSYTQWVYEVKDAFGLAWPTLWGLSKAGSPSHCEDPPMKPYEAWESMCQYKKSWISWRPCMEPCHPMMWWWGSSSPSPKVKQRESTVMQSGWNPLWLISARTMLERWTEPPLRTTYVTASTKVWERTTETPSDTCTILELPTPWFWKLPVLPRQKLTISRKLKPPRAWKVLTPLF